MAAEFRRFAQLPPEVRNFIWELTLPEPRVLDIYPASTNQGTPAWQGLRFANQMTEAPPAVSAVCRESRSIILCHYKPITLSSATKYVDLSRDMLLLESCLLEKELYRTLHFMSKEARIRNEIRSIAFGTSYSAGIRGIWHPVLGRGSTRKTKNSMSKFLQRLAVFPKLERVVFVLYQEVQYEVTDLPQTSREWNGHLSQNATFYLAGTKPPRARDLFSNSVRVPHEPPHKTNSCSMPWTQEKPTWPHVNELRYYELGPEGNGNVQGHREKDSKLSHGPWPCTVENLRQFKSNWTRAENAALEVLREGEPSKGACCKQRSRAPDDDVLQRLNKKQTRLTGAVGLKVPTMEAASLLWRYELRASPSDIRRPDCH